VKVAEVGRAGHALEAVEDQGEVVRRQGGAEHERGPALQGGRGQVDIPVDRPGAVVDEDPLDRLASDVVCLPVEDGLIVGRDALVLAEEKAGLVRTVQVRLEDVAGDRGGH
jgi:hypothetical protein